MSSRAKTSKADEFVIGFLNFLLGIGLFWALVGIFNPDIDSGTVWVGAYVFANISSAVNDVRRDLRRVD